MNTLTPKDFVAFFIRGFPPFKYDQGLIENGVSIVTDPEPKFIYSQDIENAKIEAYGLFNERAFEESVAKVAFMHLWAHFLIWDLMAFQQGARPGSIGIETSKSVGSVSVSYTIPDVFKNNPIALNLSQTKHGQKYLSLIEPYLRGQVILVAGGTTNG